MGCPICDGKMIRKRSEYRYYDIYFGDFDSDVCEDCGEIFFTEEASDEIDMIAKEKGLWGLEHSSKISYSGNSLIVRIPKDIANFMGISRGEEIKIHPEGKNRLVVEVTN